MIIVVQNTSMWKIKTREMWEWGRKRERKIEFATLHPDFTPTEDMEKLLLNCLDLCHIHLTPFWWEMRNPCGEECCGKAAAAWDLRGHPGAEGVNIGVTLCHHASPLGLPITESAPCYVYVPRVVQTPGEAPALPVRTQPGCRSAGAKPSTLCMDNELQTLVINNYLLPDLLVAAFPQPE